MMSAWIKHAVLGTFLEPAALCYAHRVRPLINTALHPERALLFQETGFILKAIRRLVERDSNCIDVGCHIGLVLNEFNRLAPEGRHIGVEPTRSKAEWLRRKYPKSEIRQCALADYSGAATFHENLSYPALSTLGVFHRVNGEDKIREYQVDVRTLDEIAAPNRRIRLIKIDAEGAEFLVVKGGRNLIARDRPAIIFECGIVDPANGEADDAIFSFLTDAGYAIHTTIGFLCSGKPLSQVLFSHVRSYPPTSFNFVALPL